MKKLFLVAAFFICSVAAMAQVSFFSGSLKEAVEKAKKENKKVLVLASATW